MVNGIGDLNFISRWIGNKSAQTHLSGKRGFQPNIWFYFPSSTSKLQGYNDTITTNSQTMVQLLKLILILENSKFVRWVTLQAYKIFWSCVFLNLFFNTMELVDRINQNKRDLEVELTSSGEMIETNWLRIIIDHYWISLVLFSLVYWAIRSRRRKKGLS